MSDGLVIVNGRGVYGWDPLGRTEATEPYFAIDTLELLQAHGRTVARPDWNADASYDGLPADWRVAPIDENDLLSFDGQLDAERAHGHLGRRPGHQRRA